MIFRAFNSISASLAEPAGSRPLVAAMSWIEHTLLGTVALTVAVVAVASVGLGMLGGRVKLRHGATVIGGCFILFGASSIVAGIQSMGSAGDDPPMAAIPASPPVVIPPQPERPRDPYAGASLPPR